jgi:hypothetical protein
MTHGGKTPAQKSGGINRNPFLSVLNSGLESLENSRRKQDKIG